MFHHAYYVVVTDVFVSFYFEGCGFVKFSHRDMAVAAINALNGIYTMRVSVFFPFALVMFQIGFIALMVI